VKLPRGRRRSSATWPSGFRSVRPALEILRRSGPGTISLEIAAPTSPTTVGTFGGVELRSACAVGSYAQIGFRVAGGKNRVETFGTENDGEPFKTFAVNDHSFGIAFNGTEAEHAVMVDIDAREFGVSAPWTRFDLHLDAVNCPLSGTVIESEAV
jgi:hypothetical protein